MSKEVRYPARQRCRACRKYLTVLMVKGQYCSYDCAGVRDPQTVPEIEWPRQHVISWRPSRPLRVKHYYLSEEEAKEAARANGKNAYECDFCWHWHIGTRWSERERET